MKPAFDYTAMMEVDGGKPCFEDIKNILEKREYPQGANAKDMLALRKLATHFIIYGGSLYRRAYLGPNQLCLTKEESARLMEEIHKGVCGPHINGGLLAKKILRQGYYWTTMEADCVDYVRRCHKCQVHAKHLHILPSELHTMTTVWQFST